MQMGKRHKEKKKGQGEDVSLFLHKISYSM